MEQRCSSTQCVYSELWSLLPPIYGTFSRKDHTLRVRQSTSSAISLSTGSPQSCILSPLLFTLWRPQGCHQPHCIVCGRSNTDDNDWAYRVEMEQLVGWCGVNNLILDEDKTRDLCGLQEEPAQPPCTSHQCGCEDGQQRKVPGGAHHRQPHLVCEHCHWSRGYSSVCTSCAG